MADASVEDGETGIERALARAAVVAARLLRRCLHRPFFVTTGLPHVWWIAAAP